jgi:uncharacterized membrane protein (DUF4010 family)
MGPYNALNPFEIWLVVVLVVSISLGGYVAYKLVPPTAGAILGGLIGGLVSSTATTVSYSRRTRAEPQSVPLALKAIMIASTVSVVRVIILVSVFAGAILPQIAPPLATMAGFLAILSGLTLLVGRHEPGQLAEHGNPAELKAALYFGLLYATIKMVTAWGNEQFHSAGLYLIGAISGLTDMDAITLSVSELSRNGKADAATAWRVILIAIMSNFVFKGGCVLVLGCSRLKKWIVLFFGGSILGGLAILRFFPA